PGCCDNAELSIDLLPLRIEASNVVYSVELSVVQHVVHLPPELKSLRSFTDGEILEDRDIPVVDSRAAEFVVLAVVADVAAPGRPLEHRSVKPAIKAPLAARQVGGTSLNHAGPVAVVVHQTASFSSAGKVEVVAGFERHVLRFPTCERVHARKLPAVE